MTDDVSSPWVKITDGLGTEDDPFWQHLDNPYAVSHDAGGTYYLVNEPVQSNGAPRMYRPEHRPVPDGHNTWIDLEQAVHSTVGAGSACWENLLGAGVFQEDQARQVSEELITWINNNYDKKKEPISG